MALQNITQHKILTTWPWISKTENFHGASLCSPNLLICYVQGCSAAVKYTNQTPPNHVILMLESEGIKRFQPKVKENKQAIVFCIRTQLCLDHNPPAKPTMKAERTSKYLPCSIFLLFPQRVQIFPKCKKVHSFGSYSKKGSLNIDKDDNLIIMAIQPEYNALFTANSCYQQWEKIKNLNSQMYSWLVCSPISTQLSIPVL